MVHGRAAEWSRSPGRGRPRGGTGGQPGPTRNQPPAPNKKWRLRPPLLSGAEAERAGLAARSAPRGHASQGRAGAGLAGGPAEGVAEHTRRPRAAPPRIRISPSLPLEISPSIFRQGCAHLSGEAKLRLFPLRASRAANVTTNASPTPKAPPEGPPKGPPGTDSFTREGRKKGSF